MKLIIAKYAIVFSIFMLFPFCKDGFSYNVYWPNQSLPNTNYTFDNANEEKSFLLGVAQGYDQSFQSVTLGYFSMNIESNGLLGNYHYSVNDESVYDQINEATLAPLFLDYWTDYYVSQFWSGYPMRVALWASELEKVLPIKPDRGYVNWIQPGTKHRIWVTNTGLASGIHYHNVQYVVDQQVDIFPEDEELAFISNISFGQYFRVDGQVGSSDGVDFFGFRPDFSGKIPVVINETSRPIYYIVYEDQGTDTFIIIDAANIDSEVEFSGEIDVTAGKQYIVKIGYNSSIPYSSTNYILKFEGDAEDVIDDQYEENDTISTATNVSLPFAASNLKCHDIDLYKFSAESGDIVTIDVGFFDYIGDLDISLWTGAGSEELAQSATTTNDEHIEITIENTGGYILKVAGYNGDKNYYSLAIGSTEQPPPTLLRIEISGDESVDENTTAQYIATAYWSDGNTTNISSSVQWSETSDSASIISTGFLTTNRVANEENFSISVSYTYLDQIYQDTLNLVLNNNILELIDLELSGNASVDESSSTVYVATAYWSDGSSTNVTSNATFEDNSDYAGFSGSRLYTYNITGDKDAVIQVTYSADNTTLTDSKTITILETLESISLEGQSIVNESSTTNFRLIAHYKNGSEANITPNASWNVSNGYATINKGSLITEFLTQQQTVMIAANFEGLSVDMTITINDLPSVSGRITRLTNGIGVSNWVSVLNTNGQLSHGMSDEGGYYKIVIDTPGEYKVHSGGGELVYTYYGGGYFEDSASILTITEGEDIDGVNIALPDGRSVSGTIYDYHTNLIISNEPISCGAYIDGTTVGQVFHGTYSDANGKYVCGGFPDNFPLLVEHFVRNGYATMYYGDVFKASDATIINISSSDVEGVDLRLQRTGSISGTIIAGDNGLPIEGATVWANVPEGWGKAAITDSNGHYLIEELSPTDHIVHVMSKDIYIETYNGDTTMEQDSELVAIQSEQNTPNVNISALAGVSISGTVVDYDTNNVVPWANVRGGLSGSTDNFVNSYSDQSGAFKFNPPYYLLPPGSLDFWVKDGGGDWQYISTITASPGDNIEGVILNYKTSGEVRGKVAYDGTGVGVSGIPVKVIDVRYAELGNYNFETLTDSDGTYSLAIPNGDYLVFTELKSLDPATRITDYIYYSQVFDPAGATSIKLNGTVEEGIDFTVIDPSTQPGDINGDGNIDLKDLIGSLNIISGATNQPHQIFIGGDVNGNSRIDLQEVLYILQYIK